MSTYQWLELLGFIGIAGLGLIVLRVPMGRVGEPKKRSVPPVDLGKSFEAMKATQSPIVNGRPKQIADMSDHERTLLGLDPSGYRSLTGKEHPYKTKTEHPIHLTATMHRNGDITKIMLAGEEMIALSKVKVLTNSAFIAGRMTTEEDPPAYAWTYQEWEKENLP